MNFSWGSDPDSFSWSQRTWKQGDLIWNCSRTMKQDDTRERTIVSIRSIFAKMMTYHKVSAIQKWRQDFPLVSGITAELSLCFLIFHMDHECQKRQNFIENPAKLILNPHWWDWSSRPHSWPPWPSGFATGRVWYHLENEHTLLCLKHPIMITEALLAEANLSATGGLLWLFLRYKTDS